MRIIIVYGGNGLASDPSFVAVERVKMILEELSVGVKTYQLYRNDYDIIDIISDIHSADGVVLATTVDWIGIGGLMQTFLDKCFYNADEETFRDKYLLSIVLSKINGERDASTHLIKSWELLGGIEGINICGNIDNAVLIETNPELTAIIDKKIEDYYRGINQKRGVLPNSMTGQGLPSEDIALQSKQAQLNQILDREMDELDKQLSLANYDEYIERQEKDIEDLTDFFKQKLSTDDYSNDSIIERLKKSYIGTNKGISSIYQFYIKDSQEEEEEIVIDIDNGVMHSYNGENKHASVRLNVSELTLMKILDGKITIQRAFMTGQLKAKGDFGLLYEFDELFDFRKHS